MANIRFILIEIFWAFINLLLRFFRKFHWNFILYEDNQRKFDGNFCKFLESNLTGLDLNTWLIRAFWFWQALWHWLLLATSKIVKNLLNWKTVEATQIFNDIQTCLISKQDNSANLLLVVNWKNTRDIKIKSAHT